VDTHRSDDRAIREGEPALFPDVSRNSALPPDLDGTDTKNKELPLAIQLSAMLLLWLTWLATRVFVVWRGWKLESEMRYYDYPFIVYPIVFTYIPLALVALGALFLWRVRNIEPIARSTRAFRLAIRVMTILTAGVLLTVGVWAFSLPWEVIRE